MPLPLTPVNSLGQLALVSGYSSFQVGMKARTSMMRIITVFIWSLVISICETAPLSFNYTNFDKCSDSIKLFDTASCGNSGVELTSADYYVAGQAHYYKPMRLWDASTGKQTNFTTTFSFSMDNYNGSYTCDGIAFFVASFNYTMPAVNASDGLLGLVDTKHMFNSTRNPFVAVEFDTHYNSYCDALAGGHVGININSIKSVANKMWRSYANRTIMSATVFYKAKNLCAEFTGLNETVVGQEQTDMADIPGDRLCYELDLKDYLTEWAVFGFSASTGVRYQTQTLKTWSFSSELDSEGGPSLVTSQVKKEGKKSSKSLMIGLSAGIIGGLAILILVGTKFWACRNESPGHDLHSDSGRRSPEGFLAARKDRSSVVK